MDVMVQQVLETSFPVAVSIFLLVRMESKLDALALAITDLAKQVAMSARTQ